jgi:hypothetical protein
VKLIDLRGKNFIASITKVPTENEEENSENTEISENSENSDNLTPEINNSEEGGTNNTNE